MNHFICIIVLIFLTAGCTHRISTSEPPTAACKPPTDFDVLVVSPFNGYETWVEEEKYKGLATAIADATTKQLIELLIESNMFSKVILSSDCVDRAIRIEGKIETLTHNSGKFRALVSGKISSCQTDKKVFGKFENSNSDSNSFYLPKKIATETKDSFEKMVCIK